MKGVQCYELFGGIALKIHTFSFFFHFQELWMMMTRRRPEGQQEAQEREGIFQQEEAWMTIEQVDTIVHPSVLRQFLHNAASRRISQDGRSKKFHFGDIGHLDFWEQFVEAVDYVREFSRS